VNVGPLTVGEFWTPQQISTGFASRPRYCTDIAQRRSTKLCTMFDCLLSTVHYIGLYIFGGSCPPPLMEFCQVQNSLCVQVLHYPILAALLHDTRAVGVSQTLWCGIFTPHGRGHPIRHWAVELSSSFCFSWPSLFCYTGWPRDETRSPDHGSPGQQFWPDRVGSRVNVSDPMFHRGLDFNMRVYRGVASTA